MNRLTMLSAVAVVSSLAFACGDASQPHGPTEPLSTTNAELAVSDRAVTDILDAARREFHVDRTRQSSGRPVTIGVLDRGLTNDNALVWYDDGEARGVHHFQRIDGQWMRGSADADLVAESDLQALFDFQVHPIAVIWSLSSGASEIYHTGPLIAATYTRYGFDPLGELYQGNFMGHTEWQGNTVYIATFKRWNYQRCCQPYTYSWRTSSSASSSLTHNNTPADEVYLVYEIKAETPGGDGSGGGPLSASIDGPGEVQSGVAYQWHAAVSGGVSPFSYQWSGKLSGSNASITGNLTSAGWLHLQVISSDGQVRNDSKYISVTSGGGQFQIRPGRTTVTAGRRITATNQKRRQ